MLTSQRLPERDAERELVAACVARLAEQPLGRDVAEGSDREGGLVFVPWVARALAIVGLERLREAEVADRDRAIFAQQHVGGLEVVMHEASGVRRREPATGFDEARDDLLGRVRSAVEPATQIGLAVLEREEGRAAVIADVVDGQHVGMAQLGHRSGLVQGCVELVPLVAGEELERDLAIELDIVGLEHRREAAVAERSTQLEATADQRETKLVELDRPSHSGFALGPAPARRMGRVTMARASTDVLTSCVAMVAYEFHPGWGA